uniref:Nephronophthisis 4 n=1 Tax=Electrophorus electricus TaxID=8005 RepID=A0A4W4GL90_ELEEL
MSEWRRIFEDNRVVPPHNQSSRLAAGSPQAFQLALKQVEGLQTTQVIMENISAHELRVTLFDSGRQRFFGRTWRSAPREVRSSRVRFSEVIYFHTALCLSSVVAVVELVSLSQGPGASQNAVGAGFGLVQLFSARPDSGPPHGEDRLSLLHGTPRALLHPALKDPLQSKYMFTVMEGTQLLYSLQPHPALTPIMHLLPPNILVSGHDLIPGVLPPTDDTGKITHNANVLQSPQCQERKF